MCPAAHLRLCCSTASSQRCGYHRLPSSGSPERVTRFLPQASRQVRPPPIADVAHKAKHPPADRTTQEPAPGLGRPYASPMSDLFASGEAGIHPEPSRRAAAPSNEYDATSVVLNVQSSPPYVEFR